MNYKEICEIIKTVSESSLDFAEIKEKDIYIRMSKTPIDQEKIREIDENKNIQNIDNDKDAENNNFKDKISMEKIKNDTEIQDLEESKNNNEEVINSPLVGTFYLCPSPDSEPFISIGSKVEKNNVVCIIEAMKLMNEIEAGVKGEVIEILVRDGEMVEYNQPLFKVKKEV